LAAAAAAASASAFAASAALFYTPVRTAVVDRATRRVGRQRRFRRHLLQVHAMRTRGSENEMRRMASQAPPLAGMDASAANLHQFVTFLARQHVHQQAERDAEAALPASLRAVREVAAPGWAITFEHVEELMHMQANKTFRACEEVRTTTGTQSGVAWTAHAHLLTFAAFAVACFVSLLVGGRSVRPYDRSRSEGFER